MNPYSNMYQSYQKANVETASPEKLVLMLYDGLVRFLNQAKVSLQSSDVEGSHRFLLKAQAIVSELTVSLRPEAGGDVARNLGVLYGYMHARLIEANLSKDPAPVEEVLGLVAPLREAWASAMLSRSASGGAAEGRSDAAQRAV